MLRAICVRRRPPPNRFALASYRPRHPLAAISRFSRPSRRDAADPFEPIEVVVKRVDLGETFSSHRHAAGRTIRPCGSTSFRTASMGRMGELVGLVFVVLI